MSNFIVCRVCLSDNIRMYSIAGTQMQEIFENLTGRKLHTEYARPVTVCYICHILLRRCRKFVDVAHSSEKFLLQLYQSGIELSQETIAMLDRVPQNYSMTPIEYISIESSLREIDAPNGIDEVAIKNETLNEVTELKMDEIETENQVEDANNQVEDIKMDFAFDNGNTSDSEDDLPLKTFKKKAIISKKSKVKPTRGYRKDVKLDAQVLILTKEEQISEVLARAKSLNYLNSPYKCNLCYKGFVNCVTYGNHELKHDESSGPYKCDVCHLRYQSARLMRTHTATAHSRYYKCNQCGHLCHTTNQARDHEKWHDGFTFECLLCGQKFRKRTSYLTHMRKSHHTESVCTVCGLSFVGKNGLLMHTSKTHKRDPQPQEESDVPAKERQCVPCDIQFLGLEAYHRHLLTSQRHAPNESSTQCLICSQSHPDTSSLGEHLKSHRRLLLSPTASSGHPSPTPALAELPCDTCGEKFPSRSRLAAHARRKHLGVKYSRLCVCETCGVKFTSLASLRYHLRTHSGARPHACTCGARFALRHALRVHARTHSGERPYACARCGKAFAQKPALNRHYRVHTGAKPYTCQVCSKSFSQSNSLKAHVQAVHLKMPQRRRRRPLKNVSLNKTDEN